jgi:hypothetical protein
MNCPACGPNSPATTYELAEKMGVFFIPLLTQRETYVECKRCGTARLVNLPLQNLGEYPADELDKHLRPRISIIVKFFALASVLLFCVPLVGIVLGLIGLVASYRTGGWPKAVSLIGTILSCAASGFFLYLTLPR